MLVRIIYRPSHPKRAVTLNTVDGGSPSFEPEPAARESKSGAKSGSRSQRVVIRSFALMLVRLGLAAMGMAAWRIATDLGLPLPFVIKVGVLSHWQVWFAGSVVLIGGAGLVARRLQFGQSRDDGDPSRAEAA